MEAKQKSIAFLGLMTLPQIPSRDYAAGGMPSSFLNQDFSPSEKGYI